MDRVNEMRYANRLNAFEREAAHAAIRNRIIQPVLSNNGQAQQYDEDQREAVGNQAQAQQIPVPVPGVGERRPYHALARENAEALNRLLTREVPILTQQLQNTMELMNQLIRRQLNN